MLSGLEILGSIWLIVLFGVANMAPVFCIKVPLLQRPVDFGRSFKGKRIFGDHKTWRGILVACFAGFFIFLIQRYLFLNVGFFNKISLFDYGKIFWFYGFLIGLGAILGDLIKSFFKRRVNIACGRSWIPFDQIDYLLGGLAALLPFYRPSLAIFLLVTVLGFVLHLLFKLFGFLLRISDKAI